MHIWGGLGLASPSGVPPGISPAQVFPAAGGVEGRRGNELILVLGELDGGGRRGLTEERGREGEGLFYFGKGDGVANIVQANQKV